MFVLDTHQKGEGGNTLYTYHDANAVRYIREMGKVLMEEDPDVDMRLFSSVLLELQAAQRARLF